MEKKEWFPKCYILLCPIIANQVFKIESQIERELSQVHSETVQTTVNCSLADIINSAYLAG